MEVEMGTVTRLQSLMTAAKAQFEPELEEWTVTMRSC